MFVIDSWSLSRAVGLSLNPAVAELAALQILYESVSRICDQLIRHGQLLFHSFIHLSSQSLTVLSNQSGTELLHSGSLVDIQLDRQSAGVITINVC